MVYGIYQTGMSAVVSDEPTRSVGIHKLRGRDYAAAGVDSATAVRVGGAVSCDSGDDDRRGRDAALFVVIIIVSTIFAFISLHAVFGC